MLDLFEHFRRLERVNFMFSFTLDLNHYISVKQETFGLASSGLWTMHQNPLLCLDTLYHISNTHTHTSSHASIDYFTSFLELAT